MKKKHFGKVSTDGVNINFDNVVAWKQDKLNHKDKRVFITIDKVVKHRSGGQNRYYWGVVLQMLSEETGHTAEEMHDALKLIFLKDDSEARFQLMKGTSGLSTVAFETYLSNVRQWASQVLNLYIPNVNEVEF